MSKWSFEKFFMDLIFLTLGCSSLAFGVTAILRPNGLITGGATGASIVISELIGIPYTMVYYGLSIAILLSSILFIGKAEGLKIVFLTLTFPMVLIGLKHLIFGEADRIKCQEETILCQIAIIKTIHG